MIAKLIVSGISLFLVVGVALAVIAAVNKRNDSVAAMENLSPHMKAVSTICSTTDYQKECQNTLANVAHNASSNDPREFVKAAILATAEEIRKGYNLTDTLVVDPASSKANMSKMSIDDCKDLMKLASASLQDSYSRVEEPDMHTDTDRIGDVKTWLSAVISLQQSCLDVLGESDLDLKKKMEEGLDRADKLTSNALAIFDAVIELLNNFDLKLKVQPSGRRLLGTTEVDSNGFPTWLSGADRKLLAARAGSPRARPNAIVAKDGSGQFKTIGAALAAYPKGHRGRYIIYVKAGTYNEHVDVPYGMNDIYMYGDGPRKTIVTGSRNNKAGYNTMETATFAVVGTGFICKGMGFQNTAGPQGHQAVALRVQSDRSAFYNCRMDSHQDTLFAQTERQFYRNCVISGTVDFIFGDSKTLIQNSLIVVRRPMDGQKNTVTASGREKRTEDSALVIQNCRIVPEQKLFADRFKIETYLGRPWKRYARTVVMESTLGDFIQPAGYLEWEKETSNTCEYFEYMNRGPGANTNRRVKWKGVRVIGRNEAMRFTAATFLQARAWLQATGGPFLMGLRN